MKTAQNISPEASREDIESSCDAISYGEFYGRLSAHAETWKNCKNLLKEQIPEPFFNTFIRDLNPVLSQKEEEKLTLYADETMLPHLRDKYEDLIRDSLILNGFKGQLSILAKKKNHENAAEKADEDNSRTLPRFIPHPENQQAVDALINFSFPETAVFIEGKPGTGKTHLASLLLQHHQKKNRNSRSMNLESFILELGASIRDKSIERWKSDLRDLDILIMDDFQFIKKTATHSQEELRKILDHFSADGKKIIFCSDQPLNTIPLRDDLLSRLQSGRLIKLLPPDQKGRFSILKAECDKFNIALTDSEINLLCARIRDDIRKLKSVPLRLLHRKGNGDLHSHVNDLFTPGLPVQPSMILQVVSEHFQMPSEAITGPSRSRIHTLPRQIVAHLCVEMLQMKLTDIAFLLNRKDHSGIIHLKNSLEKTMQNDLFLAQEIRQIRTKIERNIY